MRFLFLLPVFVVFAACPYTGNGPCHAPGDLFSGAWAVAQADDAGAAYLVDVAWQPSASVPAAFYASPQLRDLSTDRNLVGLRDAGTTGASVAFKRPTTDAGISFSLRYPEGVARTCSHGGMDDTYVVTVGLPLVNSGADMGTVSTSVVLGAY